jgi:hypothetical protein
VQEAYFRNSENEGLDGFYLPSFHFLWLGEGKFSKEGDVCFSNISYPCQLLSLWGEQVDILAVSVRIALRISIARSICME